MLRERHEPEGDEMNGDEIIPLDQVARRYGLALRTLCDRQWRERAGLPVVKLGGKVLGVRAGDLSAALRREFTPEPPEAGS